MILAGRVLANDQKVEKAGTTVDENSSIRLLGDDMPFVSRGGLKLQRALEYWSIDCNQKTGLDIGNSTGGFTDCLLQHGAKQVIAVDTGYGQIDMRLRSDPRVRLLEKTNARYLVAGHVPEDIDIIVMDVSLSLLHSSSLRFYGQFAEDRPEHSRELIVLVKPQFEVGRELVGKGGIVRDPGVQQGAVEKVRATVVELGGGDIDVIDSPILGTEGNKEFLLHAVFGQSKDLKVE